MSPAGTLLERTASRAGRAHGSRVAVAGGRSCYSGPRRRRWSSRRVSKCRSPVLPGCLAVVVDGALKLCERYDDYEGLHAAREPAKGEALREHPVGRRAARR